jgi:hypothetical protein
MRVIGIDPDSKAHGIAVYEDGNLVGLETWTTIEIHHEILNCHVDLWVVEDVNKNNFIYARNNKGGASGQRIARNVGMVQQAATELERWLKHYNENYILIPPQKGNWAKSKKQFEQITGWTKRSNEDTRAAAFFGYLGLKKCNTR